MKKTISILTIMFMLLGTLIYPYPIPVAAGGTTGNTTNNDIFFVGGCSNFSLDVGEVKSISATVSPASDVSLKWRVEDSSIIYLVNKRGGTVKIKGLKQGSTRVIAYHGNGSNIGNGNKSVSCQVTVAPMSSPPPPAITSDPLGLEAQMSTPQSEVVKPSNENAGGIITTTIIPKGLTSNNNRGPLDIVYVLDTSSSMDKREGVGNRRKLELAQLAIEESIKNFAAVNANSRNNGDRVALVTFNETAQVSSGLNYLGTNQFNDIVGKSKLVQLSTKNDRHYLLAFEKAQELLKDTTNRKKYIVLLSGDQPSLSKNIEYVNRDTDKHAIGPDNGFSSGGKQVLYESFLQNSRTYYKSFWEGSKRYFFLDSTSLNQTAINKHAIDYADTLRKANGIQIYSIGIGAIATEHRSLLRSISERTVVLEDKGGENFNQSLRSTAADIDSMTLDILAFSNIKFKMKPRTGTIGLKGQSTADIVVSSAAGTIENGFVTYKLKDIKFSGKILPAEAYNLPIEFQKTGEYTFDAVLEYIDLYGVNRTYALPHTVSFSVRGSDEPMLTGTMGFDKAVNALEISKDLSKRQFTVTYSLQPSRVIASDEMTSFTLVQELPPGVTVLNKSNINPRVSVSENGRVATITFNTLIDLPQLSLSVDLTMAEQKLSNPLVFWRNKDNVERKTLIYAPQHEINAVAKLIHNNQFEYHGNYLGEISKIKRSDGSIIEKTKLTNKAIRFLDYVKDDGGVVDKSVIEVFYAAPGIEDYIRVTPSMLLRKGESGSPIYEQETVSNQDVVVTLDDLIFDPNDAVQYWYRINNQIWRAWSGEIVLDMNGEYRIEIKGEGGFSSEEAVVRTIIIDKNPNRPPVVNGSIPDQVLYSGGNSKVIDVSEVFIDPDNDTLKIGGRIVEGAPANIIDLTFRDNQPIIISKTTLGEVMVVITADDGRGGFVEISPPFKVKVISAAPKFSLTQLSIVGNYVIVEVKPVAETIRPETKWSKFAHKNETGQAISEKVASKEPFVVGIPLRWKDVNGTAYFERSQIVKVKAETGELATTEELPVLLPNNLKVIDSSGITIDIKSSTDGEGSSSSSGNRAARVVLSYRVILPKGIENASFETIQGPNGKILKTPYYSIRNSQDKKLLLDGQMNEDGIGKFSTPVIKFIKSSTGYSQKFDVKAVVRLKLITESGEELPFELEDNLPVTVFSREKLQ